MQTTRTTLRRVPQNLFRISKPLTTTSTPTISRTLTTTAPKMSLFPRFTQEFAPLFRLMDDYDRRMLRDLPSSSPSDGGAHSSSLFSRELRSFTPKFDVKEIEGAYELHGEFPGVEQKDINIEWTDANTLTVSGRHEHVREEGTKPTALIEGSSSSSSSSSSSNKQPTVEDADASTDNKEQTVVTTNSSKDVAAPNNDDRKTKYWVSERSVGEFHRSFSFPTRVDQDAVKASLKNGILSVVVPKAKAAAPKKVNIE